jgi:hypothetical protein
MGGYPRTLRVAPQCVMVVAMAVVFPQITKNYTREKIYENMWSTYTKNINNIYETHNHNRQKRGNINKHKW